MIYQNFATSAAILALAFSPASATVVKDGSVCTVTPLSATLRLRGDGLGERQAKIDDTPQILDAFKQCATDSKIIFQPGTYNIRQVMETTNLRNVSIDILGKWVWSADNLQYWIANTLPVTAFSLTTAWKLGGKDIQLLGHGKALFDGNGQVWIDENKNGSNRKGRPISLTIWHGTNVWVDGITWRQAQFWHTFVAYSQNVTMTNLDMNTTSNSQWNTVNTDGFDSWNSKDIVLRNWTVSCGDDCISVKGNSANIDVKNVTCYRSGCAVIGSIGKEGTETVDNVIFDNFTCHDSSNAAWIKTYPGNGHVKNITFSNFIFNNVNQPIYVTPCIYSNSGCDGSRIPITDVTWDNISGTSRYNVAAGMYCSKAAPCTGFKFNNINIKSNNGGAAKVLCSNIQNQASMGLKCDGTCPASLPQQLKGNQ